MVRSARRPPDARLIRSVALAALVLAGAVAGCTRAPRPGDPPPAEDGSARIVIDLGTRHQTMNGWEATAQAGHDTSPAYRAYRDRLFDAAVQDLGIDRLRVEVRSGSEHTRDNWTAMRKGEIDPAAWRAVRYATVNDNADPFSLRPGAFWFSELDDTVENIVLPMRERLAALGRRLFVNVTYVAFTGQIGPGLEYHHQDPEEYAEFVQATYQHLRERHGFVPDAWEIVLEPDNSRQWGAETVRQAMIAVGNRLEGMGITPRLIAPSTTSLRNAVLYANDIGRRGPPRFWFELSYHRYRGVSESGVRAIASRAQEWNIGTAMLEHIGSGYEDLHQDLKIGRNSSWQQYALAYPNTKDDASLYFLVDDRNVTAPTVTMASRTLFLRQYFRYIRAGAVRVGANSSAAAFDPLAFVNPDGRLVVVVKAQRGGSLVVQGVPAGAYEATCTTASEALRRVTVAPDGASLRVEMPARGVMTIFGG
jgi:glycosyl hydrolase family 30